MSLLSEPDIVQFRREYYELLARLLAAPPDAALLATLREGIAERAVGAAQVHAQMGAGWRTMDEALAAADTEALADEFTRLFVGPYAQFINPYQSFYLTGALYGKPLADVRAFMARQSLEPGDAERKEPEDALDFELGIMARLVARQQAGGDVDPAALLEPQREFLARHLLVWAPLCVADIEAKPDAAFYKGVAQLLGGFFEVERDFFVEDGGLEVETLAAARQRYHATAFKGPIFDAEQIAASARDPKPGKD